MTSERFQAAIDGLLEEIAEKKREIAETQKVVNALLRRDGKPPMFEDVEEDTGSGALAIRHDQFYGRPLSTAVRELLEARGSKRGAMTSEEIVKALEAGDFDFKGTGWGGKDADRVRNLSITLAKNSQTFIRLPSGRFGLISWYPEAVKKAEKAGRQKGNGAAGETQSASTGETEPAEPEGETEEGEPEESVEKS